MVSQMKAIFVESQASYGSPRMTAALRQCGMRCNHKRVARLMRLNGLVAKSRRRRVRTTDSRHAFPIAPNHLQRDFTAQRPNEKWLTDFTYVATQQGWLYLAVVLDLFSRKIVGWAMDTRMDEKLVEAALRMALARRQPTDAGLLHHSDRGSQYASTTYQRLLQSWHIQVSMSRTANPYDNAPMESCIATLKAECANYVFPSLQAARSALFAYIEGWYNRQRLHSSLGYLSPDQFEQQFDLDKLLLLPTG